MYTYQNPREVYGNVLLKLARENKEIVALDADLCKSTMTCLIEKELPEQYFEMGIGEQNMMSIAGGLSLTGKIPFVNSFDIFQQGFRPNQAGHRYFGAECENYWLQRRVVRFWRWIDPPNSGGYCHYACHSGHDGYFALRCQPTFQSYRGHYQLSWPSILAIQP